jgi:hypothetical protein
VVNTLSRARPFNLPGHEPLWFDRAKSNRKATAEQLQTLAAAENVPIDDLLDEGLTQGQVLQRLREAINGNLIPQEVIDRRRAAKELASRHKDCRICTAAGEVCEGDITAHHFVPRWLMLQLENYTAYAARSKCTIPVCVGRHRDLHLRGDEAAKSIARFMTDDERAFAQKMLEELEEQRPAIMKLIRGGDANAYEAQLVSDFDHGEFRRTNDQAASKTVGFVLPDLGGDYCECCDPDEKWCRNR